MSWQLRNYRADMFTGIIETTARIKKASVRKGGMVLAIAKPAGWKLQKGDSVSINGVCSTVMSLTGGAVFEYMPETLLKTSLSGLKAGDYVNLERPLTLNARLDGHLVQGHVDAAGTVGSITKDGNSYRIVVALPRRAASFMRYIAAKGSVAVDGISLTVVAAGKNSFSVHLVPYTWEHTAFNSKKRGDAVNIECDIVAKYLETLLTNRSYANRT
jgi:riboflavin synthase